MVGHRTLTPRILVRAQACIPLAVYFSGGGCYVTPMARKRDLKTIRDTIKPYGYYIVAHKGHNKILDADGRFLIGFSGSPSDGHWLKNVLKDLKRYGHIQ